MRLWKPVLLLLLTLGLLCGQVSNVAPYASGSAVTVTNTGLTPIYNNLQGANTFQVYIRPSGTAQIYTITFEDGSTTEVPSGNTFTFRFTLGVNAGVRLCRIQTASSSTTLQVVMMKESR